MVSLIDSDLFGVEMFFVEFKKYMNVMEEYLELTKGQFEKRYSLNDIEEYEKIDRVYYSHLVDSYNERFFEITRYYPHSFRASFLVQIFSVIEYQLKKICDQYQLVNNTDFAVADLKGNSDMGKIEKFLKKACKVDFTNLQQDWDSFNLMRKIRNRIIHHQSTISPQDNDWKIIENYVQSHTDFVEFKKEFNTTSTDNKCYIQDKNEYIFTFIIKSKGINDEYLVSAERFFKNLLENNLKLK